MALHSTYGSERWDLENRLGASRVLRRDGGVNCVVVLFQTRRKMHLATKSWNVTTEKLCVKKGRSRENKKGWKQDK
jgi:hypothetical protein